MRVIARDGVHEVEIQRSRFVATVARVPDVEAAGAVIDRVRRAGQDATHHCTALRVGDLVWFRHAKSGELFEHVRDVHLVRGSEVVEVVPSYRGCELAF